MSIGKKERESTARGKPPNLGGLLSERRKTGLRYFTRKKDDAGPDSLLVCRLYSLALERVERDSTEYLPL